MGFQTLLILVETPNHALSITRNCIKSIKSEVPHFWASEINKYGKVISVKGRRVTNVTHVCTTKRKMVLKYQKVHALVTRIRFIAILNKPKSCFFLSKKFIIDQSVEGSIDNDLIPSSVSLFLTSVINTLDHAIKLSKLTVG